MGAPARHKNVKIGKKMFERIKNILNIVCVIEVGLTGRDENFGRMAG